jgi:putative RecB family exonuclease
MVEAPSHLSPSSAGLFDQCPRRWRFKYIERQPEPSGQAALVGTFAHRVLELTCRLPAPHRTLDQARAVAKQIWPETAADPDYQALGLDDDGARAFRWQGWLAVTGLWTLEDPARVEVVATEQKVTADLGGVPFVGVIDRVDRHADQLVVSDYKSGSLPGVRFRSGRLQQVMLYAAALAAAGRGEPHRARLLYLGQRILEVAVTGRRVETATGQLATTWAGISAACATEHFEAKPGVLCGWCPFVDQCPEGRQELARRAAAGTLPAHAPALQSVPAA